MPLKVVKEEREDISVGELNNKGMFYLSRGMFNEAEEFFKRAIELDHNYAIAHNNLAVVYLNRGSYKEAIRELRIAIQLKPDYAEAYNNLGAAYLQSQKYTEARWSFEKALEIKPDYKEARENLDYISQRFIKGSNNVNRRIIATKDSKKRDKFPTISLCMIVKNEEKNLPETLNSVKDYIDEIIIVDTGSTDNTVEVARSFGAKVYFYEWNDDFASARNEALRHANCEWILSIDADDTMNGSDILRFKEYLKETDALGFSIPIFSKIEDRSLNINNTVVNYLVRIFKNDPRIRFSRRVHEFVDQSIYDIGGKIERIDLPVFHRGYADLEILKKKIERNKRLLELALDENPSDHNLWVYMGKTYVTLDDLDSAERCYRKAIEIAEENRNRFGSLYFLQSAYTDLAILVSKDRMEEAIELFNRAITIDPNFPDTYYHLGMVYYNKGLFREAYEAFKKVFQVDINKSMFAISHLGIRGELTLTMLQATALQLGLIREAIDYGNRVLEINPNNAAVLNNMGIAYMALGDRGIGKRFFEKALIVSPGFEKAMENLERCIREEFGVSTKV